MSRDEGDMSRSAPGSRALSFGAVAEAYARYRPAPPAAAVAWFLPEKVSVALDLGAGTGALTARLLEHAEKVIAVEPDGRMRAVLSQRVPEARVLAGRAESLPIGDASVDALFVSSAWHWMDPELAVPEIARVLRPGGVFAILWNGLDRDGLGAALRQAAHGQDGAASGAHRGHGPADIHLPAAAPFAAAETYTLRWSWPTTAEDLVGLMGTFSAAIALSPEQRQELSERVADYLATAADLAGCTTIAAPAACHCWKARRL